MVNCGNIQPLKTFDSQSLSSHIDMYMLKYDNFFIMGDFNSEIMEKAISEFCSLYNLTNLVKVPTCYKNYINPTSIDLILTNKSTYFQSTRTLETGLSVFHKMTVTVMKTRFKKHPPKVKLYRDYKRFSNTMFHDELKYMQIKQNFYHSSNDDFVDMTMRILNRHTPLKQKYIRANNAPFMTKNISKIDLN